MSTFVWSEIRDHAVEAFGEVPHATTEQEVVEFFQNHPRLVVTTIEGIAERKRIGKVKSGWAVLKSELGRLEAAEDIVVSDESERTKALARAEAWMRATGVHYNRLDEIEDELFGEHGRMKRWQNDDLIRQKLFSLWENERPRGEAIEAEAEERAQRWIETRRRASIAVAPDEDDDDIPF